MFWKEYRAGLDETEALAVAVALQSRLSRTCANTTVDPDPSPAGSCERVKALAERDWSVTRFDETVM